MTNKGTPVGKSEKKSGMLQQKKVGSKSIQEGLQPEKRFSGRLPRTMNRR